MLLYSLCSSGELVPSFLDTISERERDSTFRAITMPSLVVSTQVTLSSLVVLVVSTQVIITTHKH